MRLQDYDSEPARLFGETIGDAIRRWRAHQGTDPAEAGVFVCPPRGSERELVGVVAGDANGPAGDLSRQLEKRIDRGRTRYPNDGLLMTTRLTNGHPSSVSEASVVDETLYDELRSERVARAKAWLRGRPAPKAHEAA